MKNNDEREYPNVHPEPLPSDSDTDPTRPPIRQQKAAAPARQSGGGGCWVVASISGFVAFVLVVVALVLPPFSIYDRLFGEPFATLAQAGDSIATEDQTLRLIAASDVASEEGFGVSLNAIPLRSFLEAGANEPAWLAAARAQVPHMLALRSPVYEIKTRGKAPEAVVLNVALPSGSNTNPDLLDLYAYDSAANRWHFVPARVAGTTLEATLPSAPERVALFQTAPNAPVVLVAYDVTQFLSEEAGTLATIVAPGGLQPTLDGKITGSLAPGFVNNAGYLVMPVLRDYADPRALDTQTVSAILGNSALRTAHAREIALLASGGGFDGIFVDYRGLAPDQRANFSTFIQELSRNLKSIGLLLGVVLPAPQNNQGVWDTGAYDWRSIGAAADYVQINLDTNPQTFQPGETQPVEAMLRWAKGEISRYKILLGLTALSVRELAGNFTSIGYDAALAGLGDVRITADNVSATGSIEPGSLVRARLDGLSALAGVDMLIQTPYLEYARTDGSQAARVWLTTGDALRFRMDRTIPFALAGVAFEDLLHSDLADDIFPAIVEFKAQLPSAPLPTDLALRWRIEGSDGLIDEITTGINEELVVTLAAPDGNYAINVAVVGVGQQSQSVRSGAAVALFRPTPTPTPLPTATPTPTPTVTPTPAPIIPTAGPPPSSGGGGGGNFGAVAPPSGSINLGAFEYGGHVVNPSGDATINAMRRSGMTWMKVQTLYTPGSGTDAVAAKINAARSAGFKILVGAVGRPAELAQGGEGYMRDYANWLGAVARLGADAIEVWNEPNLDREWPRGQISGATYTNMLRLAYQAIKANNGGTIVISGAPAPTGAEAAFPGQVMNDDRFLREMVNAGALNYADCIGIHYNEGIVPPSQNSGDPRDNYYTRYLGSITDVYWGIIGGQRPLCFTELGYLTSEGYPPLPSFFSWAQNVTVQQQAAWLAQAAAILSQGGRTRLMIVWNVDFTTYNSDPQGGFAMIRPNGTCPACDALAAAR